MKQPPKASPIEALGPTSKSASPVEVKEGNTTLLLYQLARGEYQCRYYVGGEPRRFTRAHLVDAKAEARRIARAIENGRAQAATLSAAEIESFVRGRAVLARLGDDAPLLHSALEEYVEARAQLAPGENLAEVLRERARERAAGHRAMPTRTVAQVHAEIMAAKADTGLSARYRRALRGDLATFAAAFPTRPIAGLRAEEIRDWLRVQTPRRYAAEGAAVVGWRRRNNIRDSVVTLFRFARTNRYLPDRTTEAEAVEKVQRPRDTPPPGILTPAELRIVLAHVRPEYIPWVLLGAFTGLRTAEIERLDWERHLHIEDGMIEITDDVAKRTSRQQGDARWVEMPANLRAWLAPYADARGMVCPHRSDRETGRLGKLLPSGRWPNNALRHSWLSYRAALLANLPAVADEAGNSTQVARRAYRNPRRKREAAEWFGIYPETATPANVVPITARGDNGPHRCLARLSENCQSLAH